MQPMAIVNEDLSLDWQHNSQILYTKTVSELIGKWVTVTVKPVRKPKSQSQMGYYFAVILPIAHRCMLEEGWDVDGCPVCEEMADAYLKHKCGQHMYEKGKFKKRNASLDDMRLFIDNVIKMVAIQFGTAIPEPRGI